MDPILKYLMETAYPGNTMNKQGVEYSLSQMQPEFRSNAYDAIKAARAEGIPAGIHSAFRDPKLGVGGFKNKKRSYHSFGGGADFGGIGRPGSEDAKRWFEIATDAGMYNPYGAGHQKEWNHFQSSPKKGMDPSLYSSDQAKRWAALSGGSPLNIQDAAGTPRSRSASGVGQMESGLDKIMALFKDSQPAAPRKTGGIHDILKGYQDTNLSKLLSLLNRDGGSSLPSGARRATGGGLGGQSLGGRSPVSFPQAEQMMAGRASGRGGQNPGPLMQALNSGAFPRARPERPPPMPQARPEFQVPTPNPRPPAPMPSPRPLVKQRAPDLQLPKPRPQMPNAGGGGLLSALFGGLFG